ncbi:MAG: hypothetical protein ACRCS6_01740 [Turicibacter sp.]
MDFQKVNPELFILVGELLGNVAANDLPFNVQNAVGNWLQLVGQAILTYNAQQQYYEQGPGRCFNPANFNVYNPDCQPKESASTNQTDSTNDEVINESKTSKINDMDLLKLQESIQMLLQRVDELEGQINELKQTQVRKD